MPKELGALPPITDRERLSFALDRIDVLERLVEKLVRRAGAHPPYVDRWRKHLADWPDVSNPLSQDARFLMEEKFGPEK